MKRISYRLLAGGLIVAILILALVAAWLTVSLIDREMVLRVTEVAWPTTTLEPSTQPLPFFVTPSGTALPFTPNVRPTLPIDVTLTAPALPPLHPTYEPNQDCSSCHQVIHGGGG
ncbi:MAG: hypothetical protein HY867_13995 [Chloroflexi bacterium]|nr:hypothetical protein [Chloroflexota bacterium]